jgi:hypothetical protein
MKIIFLETQLIKSARKPELKTIIAIVSLAQ